MKTRIFALMICLLISSTSFAKSTPGIILPENPEFFPMEKIDSYKNQIGVGLTVFEGTDIEQFKVKIKGVIYENEAKFVIIEMLPPLNKFVVIAGMSGSPVYLFQENKWKLLGALSHTIGTHPTENSLGIVTPIETMLDPDKAIGVKNLEASSVKIKKISTKIMNSGGQAAASTDYTAPKPGMVVTVIFAQGAFDDRGTCTITYVDRQKNKFWACGHQLDNLGDIEAPAYQALIVKSFKSAENSFKISGRLLKPIGLIRRDQKFAIEGSAEPIDARTLLPVYIKARTNNKIAEYKFQVVRHKFLTATLIQEGSNSLLDNTLSDFESLTINFNGQIKLKDYENPLEFKDAALYMPSRQRLGPFEFFSNPWEILGRFEKALVNLLQNNNWNFIVERVNLELNILSGNQALVLDSIVIQNEKDETISQAKLGETIKILIAMRTPDFSAKYVTSKTIFLPQDTEFEEIEDSTNIQNLAIYVTGGSNYTERDPEKIIKPEKPEELLNEVRKSQKNPSKIYVQLVFPPEKIKGAVTEDEKLNITARDGEWTKVESLKTIRKNDKDQKVRVITFEIDPPLPNYVLSVNEARILKISVNKEQKTQTTAVGLKK